MTGVDEPFEVAAPPSDRMLDPDLERARRPAERISTGHLASEAALEPRHRLIARHPPSRATSPWRRPPPDPDRPNDGPEPLIIHATQATERARLHLAAHNRTPVLYHGSRRAPRTAGPAVHNPTHGRGQPDPGPWRTAARPVEESAQIVETGRLIVDGLKSPTPLHVAAMARIATTTSCVLGLTDPTRAVSFSGRSIVAVQPPFGRYGTSQGSSPGPEGAPPGPEAHDETGRRGIESQLRSAPPSAEADGARIDTQERESSRRLGPAHGPRRPPAEDGRRRLGKSGRVGTRPARSPAHGTKRIGTDTEPARAG